MSRPSGVRAIAGTRSAFHPAIVRDGSLSVDELSGEVFVLGGPTVLRAVGDAYDAPVLPAPLPDEAEATVLAGRYPEDAYLSFRGSAAKPIRHGPIHAVFRHDARGWTAFDTRRGAVSFDVPRIVPWRDGSSLAIERMPSATYHEGDRGGELLRQWNEDSRTARTRLAVWNGASVAPLAQGEVTDIALDRSKQLFAVVEPRNLSGAPSLQRWNGTTFAPVFLPETAGRKVQVAKMFTLGSELVVTAELERLASEPAGRDVSVMFVMGADGCRRVVYPNPLSYAARWDGKSWSRLALPPGRLVWLASDAHGTMWAITHLPTPDGRGVAGALHSRDAGGGWTEVGLPALQFAEDGAAARVETRGGALTHPGDPKDAEKEWFIVPSLVVVGGSGDVWVSGPVAGHQRWVHSEGSWGIGSSFRHVVLRSRATSPIRLDDDPRLWPHR